MGLYNADGQIRVTVVDGSKFTGLYAPDGSWNVVESSPSSYSGAYHPCGAFYVTFTSDNTVKRYAPNGSLYVTTEDSYTGGAVRVYRGLADELRKIYEDLGYSAVSDFNNQLFFLPDYGPERVTNGTFDTNLSGWNLGGSTTITWVDGKMSVAGDGTNSSQARHTLTNLKVGALYEVSFDVDTNIVAAGFEVGVTGFNYAAQSLGRTVKYVTATATTAVFMIGRTSVTAGFVDNVSVKEVLCGKGVTYGPDQVTNGKFNTDISGWTVTAVNPDSVVWDASGALSITTDGSSNTYVHQTINVTAGRTYAFNATTSGAAININVREGSSATTGTIINDGWVNPRNAGSHSLSFTALSTGQATIIFSRSSVATTLVDNVSVQEVDAAVAPKLRIATEAEWTAQYTASGTGSRTYIDKGGVLRTMDYGRTNMVNYGGDLYVSTGWTQSSGTSVTVIDRYVLMPNGVRGTSFAYFASMTESIGIYDEANLAWVVGAVSYTPTATPQRQTITFTAPAGSTTVRLYTSRNNGAAYVNYKGVSVTPGTTYTFSFYHCLTDGKLYVGGVQLNPGTEAGPLIETHGTAATGANKLRYDWSNGKCQALLENQGTNRLSYSHDYTQAVWQKQTCTVATSDLMGPFGEMATAIVENSTGNFFPGLNAQALTHTAGTTETAYVIVRRGVVNFLRITVQNVFAAGQSSRLFNLATGTLGAGDTPMAGKIVPLGNEWFLCAVTFTPDTTGTNMVLQVRPSEVDAVAAYTTTPGRVATHIAHAQAETAPFWSMPIRTAGAAVTRPIETFRLPAVVEAILQREAASVVVRGKLDATLNAQRIVGNGSANTYLNTQASATAVETYNGTAALGATAGSGGYTSSFGAASTFDASGRAICFNGGAVGSDANSIGTRAEAYLGRGGTVNTTWATYANGRYDFLGIRADRGSSTWLQSEAKAAS